MVSYCLSLYFRPDIDQCFLRGYAIYFQQTIMNQPIHIFIIYLVKPRALSSLEKCITLTNYIVFYDSKWVFPLEPGQRRAFFDFTDGI